MMTVFALILLVTAAVTNGFVAVFAASTVAMCLHGIAAVLFFVAAGINASTIARGRL